MAQVETIFKKARQAIVGLVGLLRFNPDQVRAHAQTQKSRS